MGLAAGDPPFPTCSRRRRAVGQERMKEREVASRAALHVIEPAAAGQDGLGARQSRMSFTKLSINSSCDLFRSFAFEATSPST